MAISAANDNENIIHTIRFEGIDQAEKELESLGKTGEAAFAAIGAAATKLTATLQKTSWSLDRIAATMDAIRGASDGAAKFITALGDATERAQKAAQRLAAAADQNTASLEKLAGAAATANATLARVRAPDAFVSTLPQGLQASEAAALRFRDALGTTGARLGTLVKTATLAGAAFAAVGAGFATGIVKLTKTLPDVDSALGQVTNSAGRVRDQVAQIFAPQISAAARAFSTFIDRNSAAITSFAEAIASKLQPLINDLVTFFNGGTLAPESPVAIALSKIQSAAAAASGAFGILQSAFNGVLKIADLVARAINAVFGTNTTGGEVAIVAAVVAFSGAIGVLVSAIGLLSAAFGPVGVAVAAIATAFGVFISTYFPELKKGFEVIASAAQTGFNAVLSFIQPVIDGVKQIIEWVKAAADALASLGGGGSSGSKGSSSAFARGGGVHLRGAGTGTSDSMWARVSNGEYINTARSVRHYGSQLFHALNNLQIPRDAFRNFAAGGFVGNMPAPALVMAGVPRFAEGGPVQTARTPINVTIGSETFNMFAGDDDTAQRLVRHATKRSMLRAGKKPSWYGKK